jgi:uncharacterized integral membrane protein (TIGR00698 family)
VSATTPSRLPLSLPVAATFAAIAALAGLAYWLSPLLGVPALLIGAGLGLALAAAPRPAVADGAIAAAARTPLRLGVALLGAKITAQQIAALGVPFTLTLAGCVAAIIAMGMAIAPWFGVSRRDGFIAAGSTAICGASAAAALGSVFPSDDKVRRAVLGSILATAFLSTIAMFAYPAFLHWIGLKGASAGAFLGASIHDVAQVAGAGFAVGQEAGEAAMIAKLWRVAMLAPVVLIAALIVRGRSGGDGPKPAFLPWFLLVFLALAAANTLGLIPRPAQAYAAQASALLLLYAVTALGLATSWRELKAIGWGLFGLILTLTIALAGLALAAVHFLL